MSETIRFLRVAIDTPVAVAAATGELDGVYDYRWTGGAIEAGDLVHVPFGNRTVVGVVVSVGPNATTSPEKIRDVTARVAGVAPLSADWIALTSFAARYYHRPIGEVMLPGLPTAMRKPEGYRIVEGGAGTTTVVLPAIERW